MEEAKHSFIVGEENEELVADGVVILDLAVWVEGGLVPDTAWKEIFKEWDTLSDDPVGLDTIPFVLAGVAVFKVVPYIDLPGK